MKLFTLIVACISILGCYGPPETIDTPSDTSPEPNNYSVPNNDGIVTFCDGHLIRTFQRSDGVEVRIVIPLPCETRNRDPYNPPDPEGLKDRITNPDPIDQKYEGNLEKLPSKPALPGR